MKLANSWRIVESYRRILTSAKICIYIISESIDIGMNPIFFFCFSDISP